MTRRLLLPAVLALLVSCSGETAGPAVGQAVEIKFTAVDQRKVDLAELRGKVVLIDFWATWCGPCVAELPHVKAAYEKLHSKGFEIIGIDLDSDDAQLKAFTLSQKMEWPQYFDGKKWENDLAVKFGVRSIPTMWLIDKTGNVADLNAEDDLEAKIEKLLKQ